MYQLSTSFSFVETISKFLETTVCIQYGLALTFFWRAQNVSPHERERLNIVCGDREQNEVINLEDTLFGHRLLGRSNSK